MQVAFHKVGEAVVIRPLHGNIDSSSVQDFRRQVFEAVGPAVKHVVLDLSEVRYVDSSGLSVIISLLKHVGDGGEFHLCGVGEVVATVLRISRLDRIVKTFPDEAAAIAAMSAHATKS